MRRGFMLHDHPNLLTPQLRLDPLQRSLQIQTKINLLRRSPARHVPIQFRHGLYGLDPRVDVCMEGVQERRVV